jgi:DNA invertase Pin-like site-specific DNA recombinase
MRSECVIYCRVSTELQTKGHGLQRQLETCMSYARERGYIVVAVFSEVWTGAEKLYARLQAERMAKARNCKLVVENYDRWSRQGSTDAPPLNLEMASESARVVDNVIRQVFNNPAQ